MNKKLQTLKRTKIETCKKGKKSARSNKSSSRVRAVSSGDSGKKAVSQNAVATEGTSADVKNGTIEELCDKNNAPVGGKSDMYINVGLSIVVLVTVLTCLWLQNSNGTNDYVYVWAYAWLTAVCTGLGALPFFLVDNVNNFWVGICNASAGGMMIAASLGLAWESLGGADGSNVLKLCVGVMIGVVFVEVSRNKLEQYEDLALGNVEGLEARKAFLLMAVMTVHSLSEGIGIGAAFIGSSGQRLGTLVSSSLAIHNIPEGLAVALVLVPKGVSPKGAVLWSICSSIPQPIIALPTFAFVAEFLYFLPLGLGFAAGAMVDVAIIELLPDAFEKSNSVCNTLCVCFVAGGIMLWFQVIFL